MPSDSESDGEKLSNAFTGGDQARHKADRRKGSCLDKSMTVSTPMMLKGIKETVRQGCITLEDAGQALASKSLSTVMGSSRKEGEENRGARKARLRARVVHQLRYLVMR